VPKELSSVHPGAPAPGFAAAAAFVAASLRLLLHSLSTGDWVCACVCCTRFNQSGGNG